mmetsp:Transcript_28468/g.78438  ORF Transcript_28468/g.78438 Transcript_28468/m.78438 type:complete len:306 (+) Transcript_28468:73-990(+)
MAAMQVSLVFRRRLVAIAVGPTRSSIICAGERGGTLVSSDGQRRSIGTDGPYRHLKPRFVERKKHFNEVLVTGDRRKLLETAQDVLNDRGLEFYRPFWEVFAKRCIRSMALFTPLEVAIVLRAFDVHSIQFKALDVYAAAVPHIRAARKIPGHAIVTFVDVLPRRWRVQKEELKELLVHLGCRAADVMWEIAPRHAARLLESLAAAGVRDAALSTRVARKLLLTIGDPGALDTQDLGVIAGALVGHAHRDLELLQGLARRVVEHCEGHPSEEGIAVAIRILESFHALEVDDIPEELQAMARAGMV